MSATITANIAEFATLLGTLSLATAGRELADETLDVYYAALKDVPFDTLQGAVGRLIKSEKFFPSVGSIREACDRTKSVGYRFELPPLPAVVGLPDDDPRVWYACVTCQDQGWASHWCPGSTQQACAHPEQFVSIRACGHNACARFGAKGYGHEFVVRCACYTSNPKIRERLESRTTYAEPS